MKPITAEWVAKAEADFGALERETRCARTPTLTVYAFIRNSARKNT
jgi:hypothetical protein